VLDVHYAATYGVAAEVQIGNKVYGLALCYLVGLDDHSYVELENYKRWRDNYWVSDFLTGFVGIDEAE